VTLFGQPWDSPFYDPMPSLSGPLLSPLLTLVTTQFRRFVIYLPNPYPVLCRYRNYIFQTLPTGSFFATSYLTLGPGDPSHEVATRNYASVQCCRPPCLTSSPTVRVNLARGHGSSRCHVIQQRGSRPLPRLLRRIPSRGYSKDSGGPTRTLFI